MNKHLLFSLFISLSTVIHSMELIVDDSNTKNALLHLTQQMYTTNINPNHFISPLYFVNDIDQLRQTNKFFYTYYSDEKIAQSIVDFISDQTEQSNYYAACLLSTASLKQTEHTIHSLPQVHKSACKKINRLQNNIFDKIEYTIGRLFAIAADPNKQFTKNDLADPWYVNATSYIFPEANDKWEAIKSVTLLSEAYKTTQQLKKITALINAKADVKNSINNYLLKQITFDRHGKNKQKNKTCLTIAQLLLENGADPDFHESEYDPTALMIVAYNCDPKYAHVLLWHNAKPEKTAVWFGEKIENAFAMNGSIDWFKEIVTQKEQIIFKCLIFKHYNFNSTILPQELVQLITHNVWEICKNQNIKTAH